MTAPLDRSHCPASRHGSRNAYARNGCRCPDARQANHRYSTLHAIGALPARYVDSTGTARRIQAMFAQGHTARYLGEQLDVHHSSVAHLANRRCPTVHVNTATAVTRLCAALANEPDPQGPLATRNRRYASKRGWVPLRLWLDAWADIDDPADNVALPDSDLPDPEVVRRIVAGDCLVGPASLADRRAAALTLLARGATRTTAAEQTRLRWAIVVELADALAA